VREDRTSLRGAWYGRHGTKDFELPEAPTQGLSSAELGGTVCMYLTYGPAALCLARALDHLHPRQAERYHVTQSYLSRGLALKGPGIAVEIFGPHCHP
jgi:hypothetical protein